MKNNILRLILVAGCLLLFGYDSRADSKEVVITAVMPLITYNVICVNDTNTYVRASFDNSAAGKQKYTGVIEPSMNKLKASGYMCSVSEDAA